MIPLRDENPSGTFPLVTVALIAANAVAFLYELSLGPQAEGFIHTYGLRGKALASTEVRDRTGRIIKHRRDDVQWKQRAGLSRRVSIN